MSCDHGIVALEWPDGPDGPDGPEAMVREPRRRFWVNCRCVLCGEDLPSARVSLIPDHLDEETAQWVDFGIAFRFGSDAAEPTLQVHTRRVNGRSDSRGRTGRAR